MKWFMRSAATLLLMAAALGAYVVSTAFRSVHPVGFQFRRVESQSGPLAVVIWYPTTGTPAPTTFAGGVLLSVAKDGPVPGAGYVVVAPTHAGDNFADQSLQSSPALFNQRAEQLSPTLTYVQEDWIDGSQIDKQRIGAYWVIVLG